MRLLEVTGDDRDQEHEGGAEREGDAPAVVPEVGEGEQDHREPESGAEREREHPGRERACTLRRVLDRGDAGDDERGVDQRSAEHLSTREHLERRRERGQRVRRAGADQREEDQPPSAPAVRQRDGHQRHQHAGACHRERDPEGLVGLVEGAGDGVAVLRQQRTAEVREQGHRGQGAEPARLLRRERHRRDHRERLDRRRRWRPGQRGLEAGGGVGERTSRAQPGLDAEEPGEEGHHDVADRLEAHVGGGAGG